ncbi:unnamed protein product [Caretta caretta]
MSGYPLGGGGGTQGPGGAPGSGLSAPCHTPSHAARLGHCRCYLAQGSDARRSGAGAGSPVLGGGCVYTREASAIKSCSCTSTNSDSRCPAGDFLQNWQICVEDEVYSCLRLSS